MCYEKVIKHGFVFYMQLSYRPEILQQLRGGRDHLGMKQSKDLREEAKPNLLGHPGGLQNSKTNTRKSKLPRYQSQEIVVSAFSMSLFDLHLSHICKIELIMSVHWAFMSSNLIKFLSETFSCSLINTRYFLFLAFKSLQFEDSIYNEYLYSVLQFLNLLQGCKYSLVLENTSYTTLTN